MKTVKLIILSVLCFSFIGNFDINAFTDLDADNSTTAYIQEFQERGLANGYPDGTFKPKASISRSEFIALINRTFKFESIEADLDYTDVPSQVWYLTDLKIAVANGYIKGYPDHTFRPGKNISRQEVAVVLNRILQLNPEVYTELEEELPSWCRDDVQAMIAHGIMFAQDDLFHGEIDITREDTVVSLLTVLHQEEVAMTVEEALEEGIEEGLGAGSVGSTGTTSSTGESSSIQKPDADVIYAMKVTIEGLDKVLKQKSKYAKKLEAKHLALVEDIKNNMTSYLADYSYDYEGNAKLVKKEYKLLSKLEQNNIENAINASVPYIYLDRLEEYFTKD